MNENFFLPALCPLDGRYHHKMADLARIFCEANLIKNRLVIEIEYLLFLANKRLIPAFSSKEKNALKAILKNFDQDNALAIKTIEDTTHHDVKAIEYYLRGELAKAGININYWLHLGLTSEDINNLSYGLMLRQSRQEIIMPALKKLIQTLIDLAQTHKGQVMLARTHGQPAVPTTVGKEIINFAVRLSEEVKNFKHLPIAGKLNGAVGNYNAQALVFPKVNWPRFSQEFVKSLGLEPCLYTTQILPYETTLRIFQSMRLINGILLGLVQDMWRYISDNYFLQKVEGSRVGSSTMPQKVNPIDFENAEGNLGLANSLFDFFVGKLTVSRLQRDLSDSTVRRNFGLAFGYSVLAYDSILAGFKKLTINQKWLTEELNLHPESLAEGWQMILRMDHDSQAYEKIKDLVQGKKVTARDLNHLSQKLKLSKIQTQKLKRLTPQTYIGLAEKLVTQAIKKINQGDL
ncbi:adenylosuccinate lyase [Candidatus Beckwithbacteria bacterium RBG_13_42_9]|uniref:Adenylosuccinate lyase n=1 Tax=Candidatus Beckwithbacteria bacterium RBG_13_42_9 TaxID=1797457 RepID=A0A1F5E6M6_9BACT|nr:MAG: adenylosuccinate lyase [Candidatus Beckwithbacteria bacterium RBG_13_42_9]